MSEEEVTKTEFYEKHRLPEDKLDVLEKSSFWLSDQIIPEDQEIVGMAIAEPYGWMRWTIKKGEDKKAHEQAFIMPKEDKE